MISNRLAASVTAVALLGVTSATAQQTQQTERTQQPAQIAEQCMADISEFAQQSAETGYGVGGPPGYGDPAPVGGWYGTYGPRREMSAVLDGGRDIRPQRARGGLPERAGGAT